MSEEKDRYGGIAGSNSGEISNCYAIFRSDKGFGERVSGINNGKIKTSFSEMSGRISELFSEAGIRSKKELHGSSDAESLGFDMKEIWQFSGQHPVLRFIDSRWKKTPSGKSSGKVYTIKDLRGLRAFSEGVRQKDERIINGRFRLAADIDCGGRKLLPIGESAGSAFCGELDGDGHLIRNFRVVRRNIGNAGLFGCLKGKVMNLSIEASVSGEGNIGSLCGVNEGTISCCGAVSELYGTGDRLSLGGIAGVNKGLIDRCYAAGRIKKAFVPVFPIAMLGAGLAVLGLVGLFVIPSVDASQQTYAPIEDDKNQIIIPDEDRVSDEEDENSSRKMISFRFDETIHIDPADGRCYLNFENPSYSSNKIVIRLESSDGAALMAESGAIRPGRGLSYLTLTDEGYERINSGTRDGIIVLESYDINDDSRAMVDSRLPVHITVD